MAATRKKATTKKVKKAKPTRVKVKPAKRPRAVPPPSAKWVTVSIQLTEEQQAQLAKLGVKTTEITIKTYDIKNLSGVVPN